MGQIWSWLWSGREEQVQGGGEDQVDWNYDQLQLQQVTEAELFSLARRANIVRVGSTKDEDQRRRSYVYDPKTNYKGTMYYTPTSNMKTAEDRLLNLRRYRDNVQTTSNQCHEKGYIYIIQ